MHFYHSPSTTYFARANFRNWHVPFGILDRDRLAHMYVIGKTGAGKTTLLETMVLQDIIKGSGVALLDPHGDLVERLAAAVPTERRGDLIYLNVPDTTQPFTYNPLKRVVVSKRPLAAGGLLEVFKKMWSDAWGNRMEHILRNALLALLDQPHAVLTDILRLLTDDRFRREALFHVTNPQVKTFWEVEYPKYAFRMRAEAIMPVQTKVGAFLSDPVVRHILTEEGTSVGVRQIMDQGQILLVNLAKGKLGEDSSSLLGALIVTTIGLAAFSRADIPEESRRPFYLYIDEFQNFTTLSIANMLAELRKYGVGLILGNQFLHQLEPEIRSGVLGNVGTTVSFRLGAEDAPFMAREFEPKFEAVDLLNLPNFHVYIKLMVKGAPTLPFSAVTIHPKELPIDPSLFHMVTYN